MKTSLTLLTLTIISLADSVFAQTVTNPNNGHSYLLTPHEMEYSEARAFAQANGGYLTAINDATEQSWLVSVFGSSDRLWIGFTDEVTEGVWVWDSGEPANYTNWADGEPNNRGGNEDFAQMNWITSGSGEWNDLNNSGGNDGPDFGIVEIPPSGIKGSVFLGSTTPRIPLSFVEVQLLDPTTNVPVITAYTNSAGDYIFTGPLTNSYRLRAKLTYAAFNFGPSRDAFAYLDNNPDESFVYPNSLTLPDISFPWPIILQAGWRGSASGTWPKAIDFLTADPYGHQKAAEQLPSFLCFPMPSSFEVGSSAGYDNTGSLNHDLNAQRLRGWIEQIVFGPGYYGLSRFVNPQDWDKVRFFLIGHSMGGIIVRALATTSFSSRVERVVSLDGVHGGTNFVSAVITALAAPCLTEVYMNGVDLNFSPPPLPNTGWNRPENTVLDPTDSAKWLLYSCVPDPVVLPDFSACGKGRVFLIPPLFPLFWVEEWVQGTRRTVFELHWWPNESFGITNSLPVLTEAARFLVGQPVTDEGCPPTGDYDPTEGLGRSAGGISTGPLSVASALVPFDANILIYGRFTVSGPTSTFRLLDSTGAPLSLQNATTHMMAPEVFLESFELSSPPVGDVTVELSTGASPGELQFSFYFDNLRQLSASASPASAAMGQQVTILAQLMDGTGAIVVGSTPTFSASVLLTQPNQAPQTVPLYDDGQHGDGGAGDGVFGGFFQSTGQAGRYLVEAQGTSSLGPEVVTRSAETGFVVLPASGTLVGPPLESTPDANGNGLFDSLVFSQTVSFSGTVSFSLSGQLVDSQGNIIHRLADELAFYSPGQTTRTMTLTVPGSEIVRHGQDGPWLLRDIVLNDIQAGSLPTATAPDYTTAAYLAQWFEPPPMPTIACLVPNAGGLVGGQQVVLHGSSLQDTTAVIVGDASAAFVVTGDNSLQVTIPPLMPTQEVERYPKDVKVVTPWGVAVATSAWTYSE